MSFTKTWDETDAGGDLANTIDDKIETTRYALRERANVEHIAYADESGHNDVWLHRKAAARINYGLAANKPTAPTASGTAGRTDGSAFYSTDSEILQYYDDANSEWVTVASPNHSSLTVTYTTGTITVTNGTTAVTGSSTEWSGNVSAGDILLGPDGESYNISTVNSNTSITLDRNYDGTDAAGQSYTIYLDQHTGYVSKGGDTINGDAAVGGDLTVTGTITGTHADGDIGTDEVADNAVSEAAGIVFASDLQTTTSDSYVDLDSMTVTLSTSGKTGSFVVIDFDGAIDPDSSSGAKGFYAIVNIDGSTESDSEMRLQRYQDDEGPTMHISFLKTGLAAGSHTFKIQWKSSIGRIKHRRLRVFELKR